LRVPNIVSALNSYIYVNWKQALSPKDSPDATHIQESFPVEFKYRLLLKAGNENRGKRFQTKPS
jgi:hypothetical protein